MLNISEANTRVSWNHYSNVFHHNLLWLIPLVGMTSAQLTEALNRIFKLPNAEKWLLLSFESTQPSLFEALSTLLSSKRDKWNTCHLPLRLPSFAILFASPYFAFSKVSWLFTEEQPPTSPRGRHWRCHGPLQEPSFFLSLITVFS